MLYSSTKPQSHACDAHISTNSISLQPQDLFALQIVRELLQPSDSLILICVPVSPWVVCTLPERALVRLLIADPVTLLKPTQLLASSALPYRRTPPSWLKTTPEDVVENIIKMARKGLQPSAIGVALRDSHGIPQVRFVTGNKILRILKSNGVSPFILRGNVILTGAHGRCAQVLDPKFQRTYGI